MKKFLIFVGCIVLIIAGYFTIKSITSSIKENKRVEEAKKGWYVEVLSDYLNVRTDPNRASDLVTKIYKGEIYAVTDYNTKDKTKYWYQIKLKDDSYGWVANTKSGTYLKDYNGKIDVATPTIKYENDVYQVISINDINYNHLIVWDDRDDYKITHVVYHEVDKSQNIDQYWIKYTVTDESGKSASKVQKITFEKKPSEEEVTDFIYMER